MSVTTCFRFVECVYEAAKARKVVSRDDAAALAMIDSCEQWANDQYGYFVFNRPLAECQRIAEEALDAYLKEESDDRGVEEPEPDRVG